MTTSTHDSQLDTRSLYPNVYSPDVLYDPRISRLLRILLLCTIHLPLK
jgi:hypothetical protein